MYLRENPGTNKVENYPLERVPAFMEPMVVEDEDSVDPEAEEEEDADFGSSGDCNTSVGPHYVDPAIMEPDVAVDYRVLEDPEADEEIEFLVDCNTGCYTDKVRRLN